MIGKNLPKLVIDTKRIKQVMINLLINSEDKKLGGVGFGLAIS